MNLRVAVRIVRAFAIAADTISKSSRSILLLVSTLGIVAAMLLSGTVSTAFAAASLTPLGINSVANGVSGDGSVVVGNSRSASGYEAFRWTGAGGMVGLGIPPGDLDSYARGVNGDGSVVVGGSDYVYDEDNLAFRSFGWAAAGGMQDLGYLPGGGFSGVAIGVSADGSVIVGSSDSASGYQAFRWTAAGGMQGLGDLAHPGGGTFSEANAVSADGTVIVGYGTAASSNSEAFRWTSAGGMAGLGTLPGDLYSYASGVSADGLVVVGVSSSGCTSGCIGQAFRWTSGGGMVGLGDLPDGAFNSTATGVSADGSVVVGYGDTGSGTEAFLWTADGGMKRLWDVIVANGVDPAADGWSRLDFAKAISADGNTIVGDGIRNGNNEGFVAVIPTIVPEPITGALALLGASSILLVRRRSLWRPNKLKVLPFQVLGAVLTLAIVLATGTASAQEADTVTISGTFSMGTLAGTVGPDLSEVYANGYDHTWRLTLHGITQSHFSNVDWENTLELDATTIIHAMSFDLEFFGPDAATLNGIVSEHIAGGDVGIRLDNIYPYVYGKDGFSLMDVRLSGPDMYLWARQALVGESTLFPADADRHPVVGPEPFSMWTDYSQLADSRPGNDGAIISWDSILTFVAGIPTVLEPTGDFNHDGTVDAADYIVWRKGLGTTYTQNDYDVWRTHFHQTAGSGTAGYGHRDNGPGASAESLSAGVPEPAAGALALLSANSILLLRRRCMWRPNKFSL